MNYLSTLRGEIIKIKRTSLLYFTFLAAAFTPAIMLLDNIDGTPDKDFGLVDPYKAFYLGTFPFIAFILLPLFIVLITTLLIQIEYKSNTWKQVLASPQYLHSVLLSKFIVVQGLTILMLLIFNVFMIGVAAAIDYNYPQFSILNYLKSFDRLWYLNARTYVATFGMSALQFWLALRFRNFIAPLGIGLVCCVMSPILLLELKWENVMDKFPHALSIVVGVKQFEKIHVWAQWISVMYMVIFLVLAYLDFNRKTMKV